MWLKFQPPRITSLPNFITLHEDIQEGQLLHALVVFDQQADDTITCVLTNSTPSTDKYSVDLMPGTSGKTVTYSFTLLYHVKLLRQLYFLYYQEKPFLLILSRTNWVFFYM